MEKAAAGYVGSFVKTDALIERKLKYSGRFQYQARFRKSRSQRMPAMLVECLAKGPTFMAEGIPVPKRLCHSMAHRVSLLGFDPVSRATSAIVKQRLAVRHPAQSLPDDGGYHRGGGRPVAPHYGILVCF